MATRKPINARAKLPEQLRAAIYIRVSGEGQKDGYSLESQEERCKQYCREQGYTATHIYSEVFTGTVYRQRPKLSAMREAARLGEFDVLVIYCYDRLARDDVHQAVIIDELEHYHIRVESATQKLDDSPLSDLMRSTLALNAKLEHRNILERTERGRQTRVRQGKLVGGGNPLYGYCWNKGHSAYEIDPEEAKIVKRIFEMHDQGYSIRAIAKQLTEEGIPTRKGDIWKASTVRLILNNTDKRIVDEEVEQRTLEMQKSGDSLVAIAKKLTEEGIPTPKENKIWHIATVSDILNNRAYTGEAVALRYQKVSEPGQASKTYARPIEEQVKLPDGVIPALIDKELFERVQARLARNKALASRNNKNPQETLLRCGLVVCAHCGGNMTAWRDSRGHTNYRCNSLAGVGSECKCAMISITILDAAVWKRVEQVLRDPEEVERKLKVWKKKLEKAAEQIEAELAPIDSQIAEIDETRKEIQESLETLRKVVPDEKKREKKRAELLLRDMQLEEQKEHLEEDRKKVQGEQVDHKAEQKREEKFRQWCAKMRADLDDPNHVADYEWMREACERFGVKVLVGRVNSDKKRYDITFTPPDIVSVSI